MIYIKSQEVKTGKLSIFSRIFSDTDLFFNKLFESTKRGISYFNKHTFIVVSQWIAFHVLYRIRKVYVDVKHEALLNPHSRKVIDAVRGRGEVRKEGASFYLRRISNEGK